MALKVSTPCKYVLWFQGQGSEDTSTGMLIISDTGMMIISDSRYLQLRTLAKLIYSRKAKTDQQERRPCTAGAQRLDVTPPLTTVHWP